MNIFVLDRDPGPAARAACDKHVVKMVLETAQILNTAIASFYEDDSTLPMKRTHTHHPCVLWASASVSNFSWLRAYGIALADEYSFRYDKIHACENVIYGIIDHIGVGYLPRTRGELSPPRCMPDSCFVNGRDPWDTVVQSYRRYYLTEKKAIATWTGREPPEWWTW